jgi:hypothetical protein
VFRLGHAPGSNPNEVRSRRLDDLEDGYPATTGDAGPATRTARSRKMMADPHVHVLSHHWLILAGPAFLPAIVVVGVVLYVAIKDRRSHDSGDQASADDRKD